jgi:radical SAM protein with 4Fe4S-binding SPASM domain
MAKVGNVLRLLASYYFARLTGKPHTAGLPMSIAIEPTTACNLRCPECPSGLRAFSRPTGMLSEELLANTLAQLKGKLMYLLLYFQGEPYLHPGFLEMVRMAADQNVYTATSTNGHYLTEENAIKTVQSGLDRLIISIDGATQKTYEQYRVGGNLQKVLDGARRLVAQKKALKSRTPHIIFQCIAFGHNEHELDNVRRLAREIGIQDVRIKSAQIYDFETGSAMMPHNTGLSRYVKSDDGSFRIKNKLLNHCWKIWHSAVVTWDGRVVPCCFDKDARHVFGNLQQAPWADIWKNERYTAFRSAVLRSRKEIDICRNCTEGTKVWV